MKKNSCRFPIFIIVMLLAMSVLLLNVSAAEAEKESYTLTVKNTYKAPIAAEQSSAIDMSYFQSIRYDGCFGNQLEGIASDIFWSMVDNFEYSAEAYTYTFETPLTFEAEISEGEIVVNEALEEIYFEINSGMQAAVDAFLYDLPSFYWLDSFETQVRVSASGNSVSGYSGLVDSIEIAPVEIYDGAALKCDELEGAAADILTEIEDRACYYGQTNNVYGVIKIIHDYICEKAYYNSTGDKTKYTIEPFLLGDKGMVCEGYAKTFKYLCDCIGVPCVLVSGDAGGPHMWNYVQMDDGKWYLVDVTWDDQQDKIYDTYLLAGTDTVGFNGVSLSEERTSDGDFSGTGIMNFVYPVLSSSAYVGHFEHEWETEYTVDVEPTCDFEGRKSYHCKYCDSTSGEIIMPAKGHVNKVSYDGVEPTCLLKGVSDSVFCKDCCRWIEPRIILEKKNHIDTNGDSVCDSCSENRPACLSEGACGDNATYTLYSDGSLFIRGSGTLNVSSTYMPWQEYKDKVLTVKIYDGITTIDNCFYQHNNLVSVELPDSITNVSYNAFQGCNSLKYIKFPVSAQIGKSVFSSPGLRMIEITRGNGTVTDYTSTMRPPWYTGRNTIETVILSGDFNIGNYAFYDMPALKSVIITDNFFNYSYFKRIGDYAFYNCPSLSCINIPICVENIGEYAFYGCSGLEAITLPQIDSVSNYTFYGCESLEKLILPSDLESIGDYAFTFCSGLKEFNIPSSVRKIGVQALSFCSGFTSVTIPENATELDMGVLSFCENLISVRLPSGLTEIPDVMFWGCSKLTKVNIPDNISSVGKYAFKECFALGEIKLPDSVESIGQDAFSGCIMLEDFHIGPSVEYIGEKAFYQTYSLTEIEVSKENRNYSSNGHGVLYNKDITVLYEFPCAKEGRFIIPDTVTEIKDNAFTFCHELKELHIPGSVEDIDAEKFLYCTGMEKLVLMEGIKSIGELAFGECVSLREVVLPSTVTRIDAAAFVDTPYLEKVIIHSENVEPDEKAIGYTVICPKVEYDEWYAGFIKYIYAAIQDLPEKKEFAKITEYYDDYRIADFTLYHHNNASLSEYASIEGIEEMTIDVGDWKTSADSECVRYKKCPDCPYSITEELHSYTNACDKTCNRCGATRTVPDHKWTDATCTAPKTCTECKTTSGKALGHKYTNACDKSCNVCKATRSIKHSYKTVTTKATLSKNGKVENKCSVCGYVSKTTTVYYPKTIKLSKTAYTYNGKAQTPSVTVKDSKGNTLKNDTDYTVKYASGRKSTGKYSVTITFKGKYSGTKTLYFNILPSKTSKITPTCSTTEIKASWSKVTGASGYKVELLNSKGKVVKKVTTTKTYYTFKKLSKVTTYKIRVTAYKTIDKKAAYSGISTTITTSTAPAKVSLSKVTAGSKVATPAWKTVSDASGYQVQYSTSSKFKSAKTATVSKGSSKKTTIKKLTKGKKYYFKVRAYKTVGSVKVYGAWSSVKSVKVK